MNPSTFHSIERAKRTRVTPILREKPDLKRLARMAIRIAKEELMREKSKKGDTAN